MKKFNKNLIIAFLSIVLVFGFAPLITVHAATLPPLGTAANFSVLANTAITDTPTSSITGNVGLNNAGTNYAGLTTPEVVGTIYDTNGTGPGGTSAILPTSIQTDAVNANADMLAQGSPTVVGTTLDGLTLVPGVYDLGAGQLNGGILHLNGAGIYIFRTSSSLTSSGSIDFQNGARACDLFWSVNSLATINGSSFAGTIIAGTGIHFGANVTLDGRALAVGGDVTMLSDTISGPTCTPPASQGTLHVTKIVNGGTNVPSDFTMHVHAFNPRQNTSFPGSASGTNTPLLDVGAYSVTETGPTGYSSSGNCSGTITNGITSDCTITNTYITQQVIPQQVMSSNSGGSYLPKVIPLIGITKIPSTQVLNNGTVSVTYNYTVWNKGISQALTNVTVTDDKCTPVTLLSGDVNNNNKLDVGEYWKYSCVSTLSKTTLNTATATGYSDDVYHQAAVATAVANVVVSNTTVSTPTVPGLPKTGFPPQDKSNSWNIIIPVGILISIFSFYLVLKKKVI